ncbi:hypothetical protein N9E22_04785 [Burkholderiales bacterium]|nr:hypothetical protein [Burkholderiales bacterium]
MIVASTGFSLRYMLRTELLNDLFKKVKSIHVFCIVSEDDIENLKADHFDSRISLVSVDLNQARRESSKMGGGVFQQLRRCVLDNRLNTGTADYWKQNFFDKYVAISGFHKLKQYILRGLIWILRRSPAARIMLRHIEEKFVSSREISTLFDRIEPDFLVTPSVGVFQLDALLIREARARSIKSLGIITNWDHCVSKGTAGATPDESLVWGESMIEQLMTHHDIPEEKITICGPMHYDPYFREDFFDGRDTFCQSISLDPRRKIIFYAAMSPRSYPWNPNVIERLIKSCESGKFGEGAQLLVRLHPNHLHGQFDWPEQWRKEEIAYASFMEQHNNVFIMSPEGRSSKGSFDLTRGDTRVLANCLRHCDVLVCFFSTLNVEAAIFDKPVVNCNIYTRQRGNVVDKTAVTSLSHLQPLLRFESSRVVETDSEMEEAIANYVRDPSLDRVARKKLFGYVFGDYKGRATETVASELAKRILN